MGKNIQQIKDVVDGKFERKKIIGGYYEKSVTRKVGDRWKDSDGIEWEQKEGFISQVSKLAKRGIADNCSDCEKFIVTKWDKDCFSTNKRCYYCQIDFEASLKSSPIRWFAWRRLKDLQNMESVEKDLEQWIDEQEKLRKVNPLDKSVANALANANIDTNMKMHKSKL